MVTRIQESVHPTRRIGAAVPFHASPKATRFATNRLTRGDGRFSFNDVLNGETFPEESFHPLLYGRVLRESRGGGPDQPQGQTAGRWLLSLTADVGQDVTETPLGPFPSWRPRRDEPRREECLWPAQRPAKPDEFARQKRSAKRTV